MNTRNRILLAAISLLFLAGCAGSPVEEERRKQMEADVDDILTYENDPAEVGEVRDCLTDNEYRSYRALGKRHLLFYGRKNRQWVNVLRGRCAGLRKDTLFIMKPLSSGRVCKLDQFEAADRGAPLSVAATCTLGEFLPVTEAQVEEIENRLEMR